MDVVLSLNWSSAYQSVRGLVAHFATAWRAVGLDLVELDLGDEEWFDELMALLQARRVAFVLATGGIGATVLVDGEDVWTKLNIPVFSLLMDHPVYLAENHRTHGPGVVLGYMFRDHALFQASDVKAANLVTSIDYGIPDLPVRDIAEIAAQGRPRIVFAKTGNAPAELAASWRQVRLLERVLYDALDDLALERHGYANLAAFGPLVARVAAAHRLELQPFDLTSRWLIAQLDDYIRRLKSTAIATALLPFEVDVFGRAWEHIDTSGARARFHGPVEYAAVEAAFPLATASLTMNPNIELSAHDRFFTALGAGVMPISDRNDYIATQFPEVMPYTFDFTPGSIARVLERVTRYPGMALETARAARARVRPVAGVEQAAMAILQTMQSVSFLRGLPIAEQDFFVP